MRAARRALALRSAMLISRARAAASSRRALRASRISSPPRHRAARNISALRFSSHKITLTASYQRANNAQAARSRSRGALALALARASSALRANRSSSRAAADVTSSATWQQYRLHILPLGAVALR